MNWLLIILIIVAVLLVLKLDHIRRKIFFIVILGLILVAYLTFHFATVDKELDYSSFEGVVNVGKVYFSWIGQAFGNIKTITLNAVGMDWVPENRTVEDLNPRRIMQG